MSDVLVASLSEEGTRVAPLVAGLRAAGLTVWWDGDLAGGEHRQQTIASELETARCVVVVWTTASVGPAGELIQDVAARAKARGILLPIRLDRVTEPPLGFRQIRSLDLARWNGRPRNRKFREVVAAARAIVSGNLRFQPKAKRRLLRWLAGAIVSLPLLTLLGFFADLLGILGPICRVPGAHAVCAHWGLGGVPTREEEDAWAKRNPGDCSALRAHLARFPDGGHAEEAERKLLAAETVVTERWEAEEHSLPLTVRAEHKLFQSEEAAHADALARAPEWVELACVDYKVGPYRLRAATAKVKRWNCTPSRGGFDCGFEGQAICQVEVRTRERHEVCR